MNTLDPSILETPESQAQLPPGHTPYDQHRPRKHGCVPQLALADEERDGFYSLEERLYDEYRPTCATESLLLDEVTLNYWRLQRARGLETETLAGDRENHKLLALYFRYRTSFERSFFRALQTLRKVKAENARLIARYRAQCSSLRPLPAFVSQNRFTPANSGSQIDDRPRFDEAA